MICSKKTNVDAFLHLLKRSSNLFKNAIIDAYLQYHLNDLARLFKKQLSMHLYTYLNNLAI